MTSVDAVRAATGPNVALARAAFATYTQGDTIKTATVIGSTLRERLRPLTIEFAYRRTSAGSPNGVCLEFGSASVGLVVAVNVNAIAIAAGANAGTQGVLCLGAPLGFTAAGAGVWRNVVVGVDPLAGAVRLWVDNEAIPMTCDTTGFAVARVVCRTGSGTMTSGLCDTEDGAVGAIATAGNSRMPAPQLVTLDGAKVGSVFLREGAPFGGY